MYRGPESYGGAADAEDPEPKKIEKPETANLLLEMQAARIVLNGLPYARPVKEVAFDLQQWLSIALVSDPLAEKYEKEARELFEKLPAAEVRNLIKRSNEMLDTGDKEGAIKQKKEASNSLEFWNTTPFAGFIAPYAEELANDLRDLEARLG